MQTLLAIIAASLTMGLMDFVWLGTIAKKTYYREMGSILLSKPNMPAALAFYAVYVVGAVVLVARPALEAHSWTHATLYGALLGFVAFATYDLTNLATLKGFSRKITVIDLVWGTLLTATVCSAAYFAGTLGA